MATKIKDVEEYIAYPKYKTKSELLEFLNEELELPDFRKVKKNDMHYGGCMNSIHLLTDMIEWVKNLEDVK